MLLRSRFSDFDASSAPSSLMASAAAAPPIGSLSAAVGGSALLPSSVGRGPFAGGAGALFGGFSGLLGGVNTDSAPPPRPVAARVGHDAGAAGGGGFPAMGAMAAATAAAAAAPPSGAAAGIGGGRTVHATLAPSTAAAAAFVPAPHAHAHMQQQHRPPSQHVPPPPAHVGYMRGPPAPGPFVGFGPARLHPPARSYGCYCGKVAVYMLQPCGHPQCDSCCRMAVARSACSYCGCAVAGVVELAQ
jgi:hypothetical protein